MTAPAPLAALLPVVEYDTRTREVWGVLRVDGHTEPVRDAAEARHLAATDPLVVGVRHCTEITVATAWQDAPEETR